MDGIDVTLRYTGEDADNHFIDLYDAGQALIGFQRSLALTTHLVINGKIITQAPALKGASIKIYPVEKGSWEITALIIGAFWAVGTASKDSALGHLIISAYDYIISETLGFHVDFDKTLGQQYEEIKKQGKNAPPILTEARFDSLAEKCESAIKDIHRPIVISNTATKAEITTISGDKTTRIGKPMTFQTYEYMNYTEEENTVCEFRGFVSSYNINTYKGRIYITDQGRPVPFDLSDSARDQRSVEAITQSLSLNVRDRFGGLGEISFAAFKRKSRSGQLKSLLVLGVNQQKRQVAAQ